jgi:hypothetical protein
MKTDKNFKFPRQRKYMLSAILDPHKRGLWRKSFIQAAVAQEEYRRAKITKDKGE